jgi:hypothetical protein
VCFLLGNQSTITTRNRAPGHLRDFLDRGFDGFNGNNASKKVEVVEISLIACCSVLM